MGRHRRRHRLRHDDQVHDGLLRASPSLPASCFTHARRYLESKWLWIGVALSILIWLPNVLWQVQHHFVSLDFLSHIHARDVRQGRTAYFLPQQLS